MCRESFKLVTAKMNIITKIEMIDAPQPIVEISPKGESSINALELKLFPSIGIELYRFVDSELKKSNIMTSPVLELKVALKTVP